MTPAVLPEATPEAVRQARERGGHTQARAAALVGFGRAIRWAEAERAGGGGLRDRAKWELYLLLTDQHPTLRVTARKA